MTTVLLYDDRKAREFEPFASTRPVSEMVAGVTLIRERWRLALHASKALFLAGARHVDFDEPGAHAARGTIPAGTIIANSRFNPVLPADSSPLSPRAAACSLWRNNGQLAAVRIRSNMDASDFEDGALALEDLHPGTGSICDAEGWWLNEVWDFIRYLPDQLASDVARFARLGVGESVPPLGPPTHSVVIGAHPVFVAPPHPSTGGTRRTTVIEPHVVFDTTAGPIYIGSGSHVRAFTRIAGPCYIGEDTQIMGGDISGSSIGDRSKVRGELSSTVIIGHSNKGHDGFVGHSYLGRWVNLGAGTITSNLKNTYGPVALWTPGGIRDTGLQFLGTFFGDHVKTGIGLRLTTGTVLGAGSNVYGDMPPKTVPPFSWGDGVPYSTHRIDKFLETASRVMARRHVPLTSQSRKHLTAVHESRWSVDGDGT